MRNYEDNMALPEEEYMEILGSSICAFNKNVSFIIENILSAKKTNKDWWKLNGKESSNRTLLDELEKILENGKNNEIYKLFNDLRLTRDRIIHSFMCTSSNGKQILRTVNKDKIQYDIDYSLLLRFIKDNEKLQIMLDELRKNLEKSEK